jgi:hypothetical protein
MMVPEFKLEPYPHVTSYVERWVAPDSCPVYVMADQSKPCNPAIEHMLSPASCTSGLSSIDTAVALPQWVCGTVQLEEVPYLHSTCYGQYQHRVQGLHISYGLCTLQAQQFVLACLPARPPAG